MEPSSNPPNHFSRLPTELFVHIIFLSFDTQDPGLRLVRTEQLRLVNRAWQTTIDSTALFWACIPNEPGSNPQKVQEWIKKSGEAPLHILSKYRYIPSGGFMLLVTPLTHRWRKLELDPDDHLISTYIEKPVPLLEVFDMSSVSIPCDTVVFGGVHPVLSNVRLSGVVLPNDTGFLRNLKGLSLRAVFGPSGRLRLSGLKAILADSPHLEQLVLDAYYIDDMQLPSPILLPYLTSFKLTATVYRPHCPVAISMMIHAPNVTHLDLCFEGNPIPAALGIFSTLSVERLRQASNLAIDISSWGFNLSTEIQPTASCAPQGVMVALSHYPEGMEVAVKMLRYIGTITSPCTAFDLALDDEAMQVVFNYLKSTQEVEAGYPLPGLRTVYLNLEQWDSYPYEEIVADLARARTDIAKITVHLQKSPSNGFDERVLRWDAEIMSLVLSE